MERKWTRSLYRIRVVQNASSAVTSLNWNANHSLKDNSASFEPAMTWEGVYDAGLFDEFEDENSKHWNRSHLCFRQI